MRALEIPYSEDLLIASGQEPQELEQDLGFLLASARLGPSRYTSRAASTGISSEAREGRI
jgi:hypothetical protein